MEEGDQKDDDRECQRTLNCYIDFNPEMAWITPRLAPFLLGAAGAFGAFALLGRRRRRRVLRGMTKAQIFALRRRHFSPAQSVS